MAIQASIYSLATEDRARAESIAWARFSGARDRTEFYSSWLAVLCSQIDRVSGALLLLGPDAEGAYTPAAVWPDATRDLQYLTPAAQRVLAERRGVVLAPDGASPPTRDQPAHIGYPIEVSGTLHGVVALDMPPGPEIGLQRALRLLHWASVWLVDEFRKRALEERQRRLDQVSLAMDLVATAAQERRFAPAALAVANEIAGRLQCDRVSIGMEHDGDIEVKAISHTATFNTKMSLVRRIADAMDEVLDLDATIVWPPPRESDSGAIAHAELARDFKDVAIASVPLMRDGHTVGVLTLERSAGEPFDDDTVDLTATIAGLLAPILELKRENERGFWRRGRETLSDWMQALFGPRHPGVKLIAAVTLALVIFFSFATSQYRVSARTVVEGAVQRAAVAPFDGHIVQSDVRAGDTVRAGQVLCRLDDRDLRLEQTRLASEREQLLRRQRQALASQDRPNMVVIAAQIAQTEAQLALVSDKLARATLLAPFDGVVVSGDLTQLLGAPVEQGKILFQIAPLDSYRVILQIDERDIDYVAVGQGGNLTLSGLPSEPLAFEVQQITPVSVSEEGHNYFRVEANLTTPSDRLRPGMQGVGKIAIGERNLFWIWTHGLTDWFRWWIWKELP
ncbi:MAG: HlyD family efflux transporter periplasmic adaptor subunit [Acetobacteraceae bacterium]